MSVLRCNLYVKIILWMLLNLVLLAVLGCGFSLYLMAGRGQDGILPASLFSTRADSALRVISANLQYHSVLEWEELLEPHARRLPVHVHLQSLDTESIRDTAIPERMVEQAKKLPRAIYSFCPSPEVMFWDPMGSTMFAGKNSNVEYGLPPVPPALFRHTDSPSRYWLGRVMYIPDGNRQIHTVLVVLESDTVDGHGLFFDFDALCLLVLAILGVSFLWWLPFVRHLSRPLRRMAKYAEEVEFDKFSCVDRPFLRDRDFSGARKDEIGRVGYALVSMTQRMNRMLTGQRQFIRYVAHELNTPLAKAQMGLGVLECKLSGDERVRVQQVLRHIKRLSVLTEEVLSYLQAKAAMNTPQDAVVDLCSFLSSTVQGEAPEDDVHVEVEPGLSVVTDRDYLQRMVSNVLRNAQHYAGDCGPIVIRAKKKDAEIMISVMDSGPGVPEEDLPSLCEPFFRGCAAVTHPGGTGLGLSIVKYCIEACGGRMEYGNRRPRGFFVRLWFPVKKKGHGLWENGAEM